MSEVRRIERPAEETDAIRHEGSISHLKRAEDGYIDGMTPFGMIFMRLIPLGTLILIASGIAWLLKQLTVKQS